MPRSLARGVFVACGLAAALVLPAGAASAGEFVDHGHRSCPAGQVVVVNVTYKAIGGELHYNITRRSEDTVPLPPLRSGDAKTPSHLSVKTWRQSSGWHLWVDHGWAKASDTCKPR